MTSPPALSALLAPEQSAAGPRPPPPPRASLYHYDAIIDFLLANPGANHQAIAAHIGRGAVWVSMVLKSDAFTEHYKKRREVLNAAILDAVQQDLAKVASAGARALAKRINENPLGPSIDQLTTVTDKAAARLGFGQQPAQPAVQITAPPSNRADYVESPEQIAAARAHYRAVAAAAEAPAPSVPVPISRSPGPVSAFTPNREDVDDIEPLPEPVAPEGTPKVGSDA